MKMLILLGSALVSAVIASNAKAATAVPCASEIRAKVAQVLRASPEFKSEDAGQVTKIYSIVLAQGSDGAIYAAATYGSAREGMDGAAEADYFVAVGTSCADIRITSDQQ